MAEMTDALSALAKPKAKGKKKKGALHMHIRPTHDKKFIVQHTMLGGEEPSENSEHAPSDLKELLAHVEQHYGGSSGPEEPAAQAPEDNS